MSEFYEATFRWPHPDASSVIVTGSFDSWSCSHPLSKTPSGTFEGTVKIPWGEKVTYKYIVDGRWTTTDEQATELDPAGNLNNVFRAPARPEPAPAPAAAPETETETEKTVAASEEPTTVGVVNGIVETAKQAAVSMAEALAPGTAETPAVTPATETAPAESMASPAPSQPESAAAEITSEVILPSEPIPVAPEVSVPLLPLTTEQPTDSTTIPVADVSESKPLETLVVEGSATAETAVVPAPEPAPAEEQPSTHEPTAVNGTSYSEEKPATNGVAPAEDKADAVNGTSESAKPATPPESPKPATNGAGKATTPTTPTKEKKMRFPSLSSRHSRARSSLESGASELGVKDKDKDANGNGNGKDSVPGRFANSQRPKRRTSMFGKLKDVFSSPKKEASA